MPNQQSTYFDQAAATWDDNSVRVALMRAVAGAITGATLGKRSLQWVQADQILVRVKNTRTGKIVDVCPTPALMELLAAFKPQAKAGAGHGPESKTDDKHLAAVARKIAAMPDKDVATVTVVAGKAN